MAITTLEKVKSILGIDTNDSDTTITDIIPMIEEAIKSYCHDDFTDDEGNESFPSSVELAAIKWIGHYLNVSGVKSSAFILDIPPDVQKLLKKHRKLRW